MSPERPANAATNLELSTAFWEAAARDGHEATLAFLAEDVEFDFSGVGAVGIDEVYRGHEGVRQWMTDWANVFEEYDATLLDLTDAPPSHVIARVRAIGRARGGVPVDTIGWQVAEFRDGKIVRVTNFATEEDARSACRSRPQ